MSLTKAQKKALIVVENAATNWLYIVETKRQKHGLEYNPQEAEWLREQIDIVGDLTREQTNEDYKKTA